MPDRRFTISVDGTEGSFGCREGETIVAAMERAAWTGYGAGGGRIPVGCRRGGCGVCRVQVLDGPYRVEAMSRTHVTEAEQAEGYALACRLVPLGDLTLRMALKPIAAIQAATSQTTAKTA